MGSKNLDRVPLAHRRGRCETVADMLRQGWEVEAWCASCRIKLRVDLRMIAKLRGPDFSLWNRQSRCRAVDCAAGVVHFYAKAPGMAYAAPLYVRPVDPNEPPEPPAWMAQRGR